jgi:hypothetical protein
MSIIRAISETKTAAEMTLLVENAPEITPLAEMSPNRGSRIDVKHYC